MRHIREIKNLPISELTDEEIAKATMHRLNSKAVMLVYESEGGLNFLGRYRKDGRIILNGLQMAWEEKFGKLEKFEKDD